MRNLRDAKIKVVLGFILLIVGFVISSVSQATPAGVDWQWANPTPQGNPFNAVAHNPLGFTVAVGDLGNVVSSSDGGVNWSVQNSNTIKNLNAIYTDANTAFVAVGDGGTIIVEGIVGSPLQLTGAWIDVTDGSLTADLNGITRSDTATPLLVAVGDNGVVLTNDGSSNVWTAAPSVPAGIGNLTAVTWNGVIFVAISESGKILKSSDGLSWAPVETAAAGLNAITWTGSQFVAVGVSGIIETSNAGTFWVESNAPSSSIATLRSVVQIGSKLVAVGRLAIFISTDGGSNWVLQPEADGRELNAITADDSNFIAATLGGQVLTGPDGVNWTRRLPSSSVTENLGNERIEDVVWNGNQFVAVGLLFDSGNAVTLSSTDGLNWNTNTSTSAGAPDNSIDWDGSQFIGTANTNIIYTSTDGVSWSQNTVTSVSIQLSDIVFDGSQYIAVGLNAAIYVSSDLVSWTPRAVSISDPLVAVASNGTQAVAVGDNGAFLVSSDGALNWFALASPDIGSKSFFDVLWNGSQFIAVGDNGIILTSSNGTNWSGQTSGVTETLRGVAWDGSQFTVVSGQGSIITSDDGITWTSQASITTNVLTAVAGNSTRLAAVGWNGSIITSESVVDTVSLGSSGGGGGGSFNFYMLMLLPGLFLLRRKK